MRILVTNDDGINAEGLVSAITIAKSLSDDVWVVAPESDQSGVSHSLSLNDPLRLRKVGEKKFAVKGTPSDCVLMALRHVMQETPPDLILSGVNRGQNVAEDVTYSGTVAACMEGTTLGVRSIALSQAYGLETRKHPHFNCAEKLAPAIISQLLKQAALPRTLININFPNLPPHEVKGVKVTSQGLRDQDMLSIDARHDGRGNPYYWLAFVREKPLVKEGSDLWALQEGYVSVTPIKLNLTDEKQLQSLATLLGD